MSSDEAVSGLRVTRVMVDKVTAGGGTDEEREAVWDYICELQQVLIAARAEIQCLGRDLQEIQDGKRWRPTALMDPELIAHIGKLLEHTL